MFRKLKFKIWGQSDFLEKSYEAPFFDFKWPLAASNDLRGKNEYVHDLNEFDLEGVYEVMFLAKSSHFGGVSGQTGDKQTTIALIYIDYSN